MERETKMLFAEDIGKIYFGQFRVDIDTCEGAFSYAFRLKSLEEAEKAYFISKIVPLHIFITESLFRNSNNQIPFYYGKQSENNIYFGGDNYVRFNSQNSGRYENQNFSSRTLNLSYNELPPNTINYSKSKKECNICDNICKSHFYATNNEVIEIIDNLFLDEGNYKTKFKNLKIENKRLIKKVKKLREKLFYSPSGNGYEQAKEHFNNLINA